MEDSTRRKKRKSREDETTHEESTSHVLAFNQSLQEELEWVGKTFYE